MHNEEVFFSIGLWILDICYTYDPSSMSADTRSEIGQSEIGEHSLEPSILLLQFLQSLALTICIPSTLLSSGSAPLSPSQCFISCPIFAHPLEQILG
jgi:hypothetical protein